MALNSFLDWLKGETLPGVWNRGVQLSRAAKSVQRRSSPSPNEQKLMIQTAERPLAFEVTLWLEDEDAHCNCGSKVEPCAHIVAVALALQNGLVAEPEAAASTTAGPRLVYYWESRGNEIRLERAIEQGGERQPLPTSLMSYVSGLQTGRIKGPALSVTSTDLQIDRLLSAVPFQWQPLLQVVSELGELPWGEMKLRASARVERARLRLRWKDRETLEWVPIVRENGPPEHRFHQNLVVRVGVLQLELSVPATIPGGREIPRAKLEAFLTETLPELRSQFDVEIDAELPELVERDPSIRFESVTLAPDLLALTATIVYPQVPGALVRRNRAQEQSLHHELRHHYGMVAGQPLKLTPAEAIEVRGRFQSPAIDSFLLGAIAAQVNLAPNAVDLSRLQDFSLVELLLNTKDATEKKLIAQRLRPQLERGGAPDAGSIEAPAKIPRSVWNKLRPYQKLGVVWLHERKTLGTGAILADDMGLGKTIQTLAVLEGRALIVVPASLLYNWREELRAHRPELKVCVYHGPGRNWDIYADVILSTYGTVRSETARFHEPWTTLVLDEAHYIRNAGTVTAGVILDLPVKFPIALTGTPVQNRAEDLETLLRFISPRRKVERRMLPAYLLRRTKDEVLPELPEKTRIEHHLELSAKELDLYRQVFAAAKKEILEKLARREGNFLTMFESLLRAREVCDHVGLVDRARWNEDSTKVNRVLDLVTELREAGHSVLVYSQWTRFLDRLERELPPLSLRYVRLDGSTTKRGEVIREFNESPEPTVFLLSLHAGGVGLNLTKADHVIFCEPWWNPFVEFQAEDRVHRIGQKNAVTIHRLLCSGTIEEKIRELQKQKAKLGEAILVGPGGEMPVPSLMREDIELLIGE